MQGPTELVRFGEGLYFCRLQVLLVKTHWDNHMPTVRAKKEKEKYQVLSMTWHN
jgi:hypothetical protein